MKFLITGATGLVGNALAKQLIKSGHEVNYLTTSDNKSNSIQGAKGFHWNPKQEIIDDAAFDDVDVIIHLAGATLNKRWTPSYKKEIIESRVLSAQLIYHTLENIPHQVRHWISASGIAIYPNNQTKIYSEKVTEKDSGFLAKVVEKWEASADRFEQLGIKVSKLRTGPVLSRKSGMLAELKKPVAFGFGAKVGSGNQWISWIHLSDLVDLYQTIAEKSWIGTFNATAPIAVTNREFMRAFRKKMSRFKLIPAIPESFIKLGLGERYRLVVDSQHVIPEKAKSLGFQFKHPHLESALNSELT